MKIALVGIGKIARDQHIPAIENSPSWELAATVSRDGVDVGFEKFPDLNALLNARPEIQVVSFCTPAITRFALAAEALRAGRHVMLEKPPGATLSECHALSVLARNAGKTLFATWHAREAAQVERARTWISGKNLRKVGVTWKEDVRRWHPNQDWVWEPGGLGVFDAGINGLSILSAILPSPFHLVAATLEFPSNREAPIAANLTFAYSDGAEINALFDWRSRGEEDWRIEIEADQGQMVLAGGGRCLILDGVELSNCGAECRDGEYDRLYAKMASYVTNSQIDMDITPLRHVADAFLIGRRKITSAFE